MKKLKLNKFLKCLFLIICTVFISRTAFAQNITLRGKVVDSKGESLIGATVKVKATPATATTTNISGDFVLPVPAGTTAITISYVGYVAVDIPIKPTTTNVGQIPLANDANSLSEVVVVGYGSQNKRDVTGATTSLDAKSLSEVPATNVAAQLQGKVAGLDVIANGSGLGAVPTLHLRGNRTIGQGSASAADQPLIVLDGSPYFGSINDVNPADIKNLEVLKDASATAIYGSRGSGGVILITTNRGRVGNIITSFDAYYGISNVTNELHVLNGTQYAQLKTDALAIQPLQNTSVAAAYPLSPAELQGITNGTNTDWQKALLKTGYVDDQSLGISGGTENVQFHVAAGYRVETGVEALLKRERYNLQANLDAKLSKHFKVGFNLINTLTFSNNGAGSQLQAAARVSPLMPIFNADGSLDVLPYIGQTDATTVSPLLPKYNGSIYYNKSHSLQNFGTAYVEWNIIKGLTYRLTLNGDYNQGESGSYNGVNGGNILVQSQTSASTSNNENWRYIIDNLLTFDRTFGKHHVTFTALFSNEKYHTDSSNLSATNIPTDANVNSNLSLGTFSSDGGSQQEYGIVSEMARANYAYDNRYALTLTVRNDANSTLATGHQYLAYPAFGAAWNISNEKWMQQYNWVNNLKLRAGYGVTSNGALNGSPYQTLGALSSNKFEYGGVTSGDQTGYLVGTLANYNLTWQKTGEWNVGFDFSVLKNRLSGTIDVYTEKTTGILLNNVLPPSTGATGQQSNLGTSAGKGLEISLSSINIQSAGGFSWSTDFNIAFSRERIVALPNGVKADIGNGEFVGWPLSVIYDVKKIGIFQVNDPALAKQTSPVEYPGQIRVQDVNGDGVINSADNQIVGTFQPQYTGGITNRFTYKNFDLSIVINARMGQSVIVPYLSSGGSVNGWAFLGNGRGNQPYLNYWTPSNPTGQFVAPNEQIQTPTYGSTDQYFDGSWIKARSINFGYNIPPKLLSKVGISSLRVYLNCINPFVIYAPVRKVDDGMDPEANAGGSGVVTTQSGSSPAPRSQTINIGETLRTFNLGINLRF